MLQQTKDTVEALKKAGYKRSEFRVQTERIYQGKNPNTGKIMYAYGNAKVIIWADLGRQFELAQAVVDQGIGVTIPVLNGKNTYPRYSTIYGVSNKIEYWIL